MASDLFNWLDALWNKKRPPGIPPVYMMHRFLAFDRELANVARYLQSDLQREPDLVFGTWQALLPRAKGAPRLGYVAPKRPKAAEELTQAMMRVTGERRVVVEEMQELVATELAMSGRQMADLYFYYGVEPPEDTPEAIAEDMVPTKRGGLLDL